MFDIYDILDNVLFLSGLGALCGGFVGVLIASKTMKGAGVDQRPMLTGVFLGALAFMILCWGLCSILMGSGDLYFPYARYRPWSFNVQSIALTTIYVPPLLFIPGGILCILIAWISTESRFAGMENVQSDLQIDYACRMTWMSFWCSMLGAIPGYTMLAILAWMEASYYG